MSVIIIRLRSAGIIEQPAKEHRNEQRDHHAEISAEHGSVTLNAVFSEITEACNACEEEKECNSMFPAKTVGTDGTDIIVEVNNQQECKRCHLCDADKSGIGIQLVQKREVHQRLVGPQRIRQNFNGCVRDQEHLPYIAGAAAGIIHFCSPVIVEEGEQCKKGNHHQQSFQKEDGRPIRNISGGIRYRDAKRQTLQERNGRNGAFSDKTAVKQSAETRFRELQNRADGRQT